MRQRKLSVAYDYLKRAFVACFFVAYKVDNAEMLASIEEIDGGLIALTRFQGEIGFYPDEYIEIIRTYLGK